MSDDKLYLHVFQNLVGSLERSRAAMAEDLANLSAQYDALKKEVETIPPLQQKLQVSTKYNCFQRISCNIEKAGSRLACEVTFSLERETNILPNVIRLYDSMSLLSDLMLR